MAKQIPERETGGAGSVGRRVKENKFPIIVGIILLVAAFYFWG